MTIEGIEVNLGSVTLTVEEMFKLANAKRAWIKTQGFSNNEESTEAFLKEVLFNYINQNSK